MSQHTDILFTKPSYTRADYTALRAHCLNIPVSRIANLYYSDDSPEVQNGLERFLLSMRADLIERSIAHNPALANALSNARKGGSLTTKALEILIQAANIPYPLPQLGDKLSQWLKPKTATALRSEGLISVKDLVLWIERRGESWWRSVPRIGKGKAEVIRRWLVSNKNSLGNISFYVKSASSQVLDLVEISPQRPKTVVPFERISASRAYDGSNGINRASAFCFISAKNDFEAIHCYLDRYIDQHHAFRAYRKELERFLLWSILIKAKPMSSLLVSDCEEYKQFLKSPHPNFCGDKAPRGTPMWRPFSIEGLSDKSQRQAIIILRAAFDYLVKVRYLGGNPWAAVKDPVTVKEVDIMAIEKALSEPLWIKLIDVMTMLSKDKSASQIRTVLAAILLMGDSGLRREEVSRAKREDIRPSKFAQCQELDVIGKGHKRRFVPISSRTMAALCEHWIDRNIPIDSKDDYPLLAPIVIPGHDAAQKKHNNPKAGYRADSLYRLIQKVLLNLINLDPCPFDADEITHLKTTTAHAFRHTFGTLSVANKMPIDVVQSVLGHASVGTTSIYVQSKKQRIMQEAAKYYEDRKP